MSVEAGTISFSGGRTSAYMLRRMMDNGQIGPDTHVLFANTGREREETLRFVRDVSERWNVRVVWLEYTVEAPGYRVVDFATASRGGEPFEALVVKRKMLPNPVMRFCTQELKIRPMREYMKAAGYDHWTNYVGIRADEPRRVARLRAPTRGRFDVTMPLADIGVTLADVDAFWAKQPFDLALQPHEGNCDLCFLKRLDSRVAIAKARPDLAAWWHRIEAERGATFRKEGSLVQLVAHHDKKQAIADQQGDLFTCFCGDGEAVL